MPLFPVFSFRLLQSELFNVEKVTFYCDVRAQLSGLRSSFRPSLPRKQNRRLGSHVSREAALGLSYALAKGKHFTREEFVSMLLTSVNDIDSRFEGSKTSGGTINLEKYRGKMGTGLTDAYQLLMQIEGTPCLKVKTGKLELVTLTKHFGGSAKDLTYMGVEVSAEDCELLVAAVDVEEREIAPHGAFHARKVPAQFVVPTVFGFVAHDFIRVVDRPEPHFVHHLLLEQIGRAHV